MAHAAKTCFFAYAGGDAEHSEVIEAAIDIINARTPELVHIQGWKALNVPGTIIIENVCKAIEQADVFICDLTRFNVNVLFELGYAIAKDKRIWIVLDPSIESAKRNYRHYIPLGNIGYSEYQNAHELVNRFFASAPYDSLDETIYRSLTASYLDRRGQILYLKAAIQTHASTKITRIVKESGLQPVIDDATEVNMQSLSWYFNEVLNATGVLIHLLDDERANTDRNLLQNPKMALVAGLAHGMGKDLLMLAQSPYIVPIDYMHLMYVNNTAIALETRAKDWLTKIKEKLTIEKQTAEVNRLRRQASLELRDLLIGEAIAELEAENLLDYFVTTTGYLEAAQTPQSMIFVGRKGSGKSANLIVLSSELRQGRRNHVCSITPPDYELQGIIRLLSSTLAQTDAGYLNQSLWKLLIYTELARSVYEELLTVPMHESHQKFFEFVEQHSELIRPDFSIRLENAVNSLLALDESPSLREQRSRVSEVLHSGFLPALRRELGSILSDRNKVIILIDNLDKAWGTANANELLANFLFGLLSASKAISDEISKEGITWKRINVSLLIFLRSDIFAFIQSHAREADKLVYSYIRWDQPEQLFSVVEQRFDYATDGKINGEKVWEYYFPESVRGQPVKEYIVSRILPRPRDIILFCKAALDSARNRRHGLIEESDMLQAEETYSSHALTSLLVELRPQIPFVDDLILQFAGKAIASLSEIRHFLNVVGISLDEIEKIIDLLCEAAFLGVETRPNHFEYFFDEENMKRRLFQTQAEKLVVANPDNRRFKVHPAYYAFLEIEDAV